MKTSTSVVLGLALLGVAAFTLAKPGDTSSDFIDTQTLVQTSKGERLSKHWAENLNANGARHLRLDIQFGEIKVVAKRGNEFHADYTKEVSKNPNAVEKAFLNNDWLQTRREGDTIIISEIESKKPNLDDLKGENHLNLIATIEVPEGLEIETKVMAGSLDVKGRFEEVNSNVQAGQLSTDDLACSRALKLKVGAGEVDAKLSQTPSQNSAIEVGVGEISLDLKGNATLEASVGVGDINGSQQADDDEDEKGLGSKQTISIGSGGTSMTLKVGAGSISVGQGKTIRREKRKSGDRFHFNFKGDWDKDGTFDKDIEAEISKTMSQVDKEVSRALADAQQEIERAQKESMKEMKETEFEMKSMSPEIKKLIQDSMKLAEKAVAQASKEIQKALKKSSKEKKNESV